MPTGVSLTQRLLARKLTSASAYSTASFTYDASSPDFVPYADLTEEMVLGWCFDGDVDKDAIEASLTANIEEQKNPTTQDGVPW